MNDLNQVAAYDWAAFIKTRVSGLQPHADLDGLTRGGYKLVYLDRPSRAAQILSDPGNVLYSGQELLVLAGIASR